MNAIVNNVSVRRVRSATVMTRSETIRQNNDYVSCPAEMHHTTDNT